MSITTIPQGWQCPGCKMIYSPTTAQCSCQVAGKVGGVRIEDYLNPKPGVIYGNGGYSSEGYLPQNQGKNTL